MTKKIYLVLLLTVLFFNLQAVSQNNKKMKIIYIMDPQCGWCYGNSKNIIDLRENFKDKFEFELLLGGMWIGNDAPKGGNGLNQFIKAHAPRMEKTTGVEVGVKYYELTNDITYQFSSLEPCAAIQIIKENYPDRAFEFTSNVQKALFIDGDKLDNINVYLKILKQMKIDDKLFTDKWMKKENLEKANAEFVKASRLANGFPSLILDNNGSITELASGYFNYSSMENKLNQIIQSK